MEKSKEFIALGLHTDNLDIFYIRKSILCALENALVQFKGSLLDVGCGKMPYREYIRSNSGITHYTGLDIEGAIDYSSEIKPDVSWNGITMPFENSSFNTAIATEVLEHCPDPSLVIKEVFRVLESKGLFFGTIPFLWPLHEVPHDEYRYTPFALKRLLIDAGFELVKVEATGGWHAAMAQMLGLWVSRSPMTSKKRKFLKPLLKLIIKKLINLDKFKGGTFKESQMITGVSFTAFKP